MINLVLAEDDSMIRRLTKEALTDVGYNVKSVESGVKALSLIDHTTDLLITDFDMPGMNGGQLVEQVYKKGFTTLPIILITGGASRIKDIVTVPKPFHLNELVKAIEELLPMTLVSNGTIKELC